MGAWSTSVTGNDTAKDLYIEYSAAFYKYGVEEALEKIDRYVRTEMCDESDEEEWCNYFYSLADFMWKKGNLTDSVKLKAIQMIDSGFGLEIWAEEGQKVLESRKKKLDEFRKKLLSPQPPKKKIKPNVHTERIFENGDIVAVQLQTEGKPYIEHDEKPISEDEFRAVDGKYVLMQLIDCYASWSSKIVPEVKDYWACFRLFDGIFETIPENIDFSELKEAEIHQSYRISSLFTCESNMFYFKRRNYKIICNRKDLIADIENFGNNHIFWGINKPWLNPDSQLIAAMGKQVECCEYTGDEEKIRNICRFANRFGRFDYSLSREENEKRYITEENIIAERIDTAIAEGGTVYSICYGREIGVVTVRNGHIDNLYIEGKYQRNGFGTRLLEFAFSMAGEGAYIMVPETHDRLLHICNKIGLVKKETNGNYICFIKA